MLNPVQLTKAWTSWMVKCASWTSHEVIMDITVKRL